MSLLRRGDQVVVAVGEDREPPAVLAQSRQRRADIVEDGHVRPSADEGLVAVAREVDPHLIRGAAQALAQHLPVGRRRPLGLELQLVHVVGGQHLRRPRAGGRLHRLPHPGPPVDQRPVAVERHPFLARHRISDPIVASVFPMLDHLTIRVTDRTASERFYATVLPHARHRQAQPGRDVLGMAGLLDRRCRWREASDSPTAHRVRRALA